MENARMEEIARLLVGRPDGKERRAIRDLLNEVYRLEAEARLLRKMINESQLHP